MLRPALPAVLCLYCLLLVLPARAALDDQQRALQQLQVQACRAVGSLLLLRGEGFQENHARQLQTDLAALDAAVRSYAKADAGLQQAYQTLAAQIHNGTAYGPKEDDLPWTYAKDLSRALRDFLLALASRNSSSSQCIILSRRLRSMASRRYLLRQQQCRLLV